MQLYAMVYLVVLHLTGLNGQTEAAIAGSLLCTCGLWLLAFWG